MNNKVLTFKDLRKGDEVLLFGTVWGDLNGSIVRVGRKKHQPDGTRKRNLRADDGRKTFVNQRHGVAYMMLSVE